MVISNYRLKEQRERFEAGERQELEAKLAPVKRDIAFDRLYQLSCFDEAAAEIGYDPSQRVVEPEPVAQEPELTINDLEGIDTSTKAGRAKAHQIVADAVFGEGGEARTVFNQFVAHGSKAFGHDLTEEEQRAILDWFVANNRSFLSNSYDECRVNLVRRGILPSALLTEDEILAGSIENEDTQNYESRRRLKQEILALRKR